VPRSTFGVAALAIGVREKMGCLRAILAMGVVLTHARGLFGYAIPGDICVQSFYIISGFFITLILNEKYTGENSIRLFYSNRFIRIYSIYYIFLGISLVVSGVLFFADGKGTFGIWQRHWLDLDALSRFFLEAANIFIFGQDATLFLGLNQTHLVFTGHFNAYHPAVYEFLFIPQAWSLGLELTFYVMAPFIVRRSPWVIGTIAACSVAARAIGYACGLREDPWSYRFFPFELSLFLAGALSYHIYRRIRPRQVGFGMRIFGLGVIPAILLFPFVDYHPGSFSAVRVVLYTYLTLGLPVLFLLSARNARDRAIGEISYPIYLVHLSIIDAVDAGVRLQDSQNLRALLICVITIGLAAVAVRYIDNPINTYRQRRIAGTGPPAILVPDLPR
jgi:peptidoglycan/LPS O-acetylase OafA/YrhL